MEDKDIEIIEEFIRNYKDVQEKYKDDEIQAEIERSCYFEEVPAIQIENLLQAYKQDEKVIDEMARMLVEVPNNANNPTTAVVIATINRDLEIHKKAVINYIRNKVNNEFDVEEFINYKINKGMQKGGGTFPIN